MKLFLDTANLEALEKWAFFIDGVTTNPSNLAREGRSPTQLIKKICALLPTKSISVEITEKSPSAVFEQAKTIAALAQNITVKIPGHASYYKIIDQLIQEGISINITLVFSLIQALYMCKLGATYISPFVGRLEEIDGNGTALLYEIRQALDLYHYPTQLLAASLRSVDHIHHALLAGADIITLSPGLLEQSMQHPLIEQGIEKFDTDWQKLGIKQFP